MSRIAANVGRSYAWAQRLDVVMLGAPSAYILEHLLPSSGTRAVMTLTWHRDARSAMREGTWSREDTMEAELVPAPMENTGSRERVLVLGNVGRR
jgi:hypothetical protein